MKKTLFLFFSTLFFSIIFIIFLSSNSFAAYPKLVSTLINGFQDIKSWIIKISTPAAAVAVRHWYIYAKV